MISHWPKFTLVRAKHYPKLWGNCEPLNFLIFLRTNYCELKPFLEMVLRSIASWLTNFIFRSYDWHVKVKFVIFGCFLPHLTIHVLAFLINFRDIKFCHIAIFKISSFSYFFCLFVCFFLTKDFLNFPHEIS